MLAGPLRPSGTSPSGGGRWPTRRVCKFIVPNQQVAPITVQIDGYAPVTSCTGLTLRCKSRMVHSGVFNQTLDMWNWTTGAWDTTVARTDVRNTGFTVRDLVASGSLSDFLRSSDGALRARYRIRQAGPSATLNWCHEVDQSVWLVTP